MVGVLPAHQVLVRDKYHPAAIGADGGVDIHQDAACADRCQRCAAKVGEVKRRSDRAARHVGDLRSIRAVDRFIVDDLGAAGGHLRIGE